MNYIAPTYTIGSNIRRLTEGQLLDLAVGDPRYTDALIPFFSSNFDTTDVSKPHAYLVWMLYDNDMKLIVEGSGAKRVTDPNALKELLEEGIPVVENGYLHAYVSNGSVKDISFDNFLVTYMRGKTRQINHYYPYGLTIAGIDGDYDDYLNKYTSKELQTGEFDPAVSTGLEMFDFGSRFYDPQIGRWHTPDPAEQFANPYLAMGNNPVVFIDPDGEFITWSFHKNGFSIGVNFTPKGLGFGGGLNFGWGDGFSTGVYGEVGYRVGGTGFGAGVAVTQNIDHNFRHQTTTTTTSVGPYASFGPLNAGANVGSTYDLTNGEHAGYSWGVSAGIGVGNEQGGIGLFVGYGSGGWNYGLGGYYDPRVEFNSYEVALQLNKDGTYDDKSNSTSVDKSTNFENNPYINETYDSVNDMYTYEIDVPHGNKIVDVVNVRSENIGLVGKPSQNKGVYTFTTINKIKIATIYSNRPYADNYFNFKNFNTYHIRGKQQQPKHLNLFGYTWFR